MAEVMRHVVKRESATNAKDVAAGIAEDWPHAKGDARRRAHEARAIRKGSMEPPSSADSPTRSPSPRCWPHGRIQCAPPYSTAGADRGHDAAGDDILPQAVSEIPWGHNIILLQKLKNARERLWYAQQTTNNGWSRAMLTHWIESDLYARQGKAVTNFPDRLPPPQSELAQQALKDPYVFDFLTIAEDAEERAVEGELVSHIMNFLLEMGAGFSFVGRQVHLEVEGEDYYVDLLFYHLRLRCFVVIDLKAQPFKPEFAGKMNFYLSAVDDWLRHARVPRLFSADGEGQVGRRQLFGDLKRFDFGHAAAHGAKEVQGAFGSFFLFLGLPHSPGARDAYLSPHRHRDEAHHEGHRNDEHHQVQPRRA